MNLLNTLFLICSTSFFLYMGMIWVRKNIFNLIVKLYLFTSGIAGIILILYRLGYLIKL